MKQAVQIMSKQYGNCFAQAKSAPGRHQSGCGDPEDSKDEAGCPDHAKAMHRPKEPQPPCKDQA